MALRHISEANYKYTDKQLKCLHEYIKTGSKFKAYQAAYESSAPPKTVRNMARLLFKLPQMQAALEIINHNALEVLNGTIMKIAIDAAWVLKRAALLADFNIRRFIRVDANGNAVYDFSNATDDDWYCISEYTVDEIAKGSKEDVFFVERVKLKTVDKIRALELVGRHVDVQAFRDNVVVNPPQELPTLDPKKLSTDTLEELLEARIRNPEL